MTLPVLSSAQVQDLLRGRQQGQRQMPVSLDLGRSTATATLEADRVRFAEQVYLTWEQARQILRHPNAVFAWNGQAWEPVRAFSDLTGRVVALYPTRRAPTLLVSGIPMHRVRHTDPWQDTQEKVRALRPRGRVLDTCFGLGYSALQAARTADWVLGVELDPAVLAVARRNPWSTPAWDHPHLRVVQADVAQWVTTLPSAFFSAVLHDPPQFALAGDLYGRAFYEQLYRVLKPGGRLFHYIGSQDTKMGRNVTRGVMERLRAVGFRRVKPVPRAFGVLAIRPR